MIPLGPEIIFFIGKFPVTNSFVDTIFVDIILISFTFFIYTNLKLIPGKIQNMLEAAFSYVYDMTETTAGNMAMTIFPFFMTFFLFILISNWSGLLPGIGALGFYHGKEFIPLFRSPSTDLNGTLALALVSIVATHSLSISKLGLKGYFNHFFQSFNPLHVYTGVLEVISEFVKIISFSFRLFGNIYVGETMISQLSTVFALILPVPLLLYETAVGLIQAAVFGMLTMVFMSMLTSKHEGGERT